jgi:cytochrome c553
MIRRLTLALAALALPLALEAASTARTEFDAAVRATPDLRHGAELFETCAACHGPRGEGLTDGNIPAIAGQHLRVLVKQLTDFRSDKRWDIRMEHFTDRHHLTGPQDVADVAGHIASLERPYPVGIGPGRDVGRGASVYFRDCESCHGPVGEGDAARGMPRLGGQHYEYLLRQFYDAVEGRRPNMAGEHARLLGRFDRDDIVGVADYLSRLSPKPRAASPAAAPGGGAQN